VIQKKGKIFQHAVAKMIAQAIGLDERDVRSCIGGKTEADVQLSSEAEARYPYHTECKAHKILQIPAWLKQAKRDSVVWIDHRDGTQSCDNKVPTVVFKVHGVGDPYIVLPFHEWLYVIKENLRHEQ